MREANVRRLICCLVALSVLILINNRPAAGQNRFDVSTTAQSLISGASGGPILDWIQKLSGPGFARAGAMVALGSPVEFRLAYLNSIKTRNRGSVTPDEADITLESLEFTAKARLVGPIEVGSGYAHHWFKTELNGVESSFQHYSIPAFLNFPRSLGRFRGLPIGFDLRAGAHAFPPFEADDFAPAVVGVDRSDWEFTWFANFAFEVGFK
jgi:hypothetical protein